MAELTRRLRRIRPVRQTMDVWAARLGYTLSANANNLRLSDMSREFLELYDECREFTMTSVERMCALYEATRYVIANDIPGDFVECGVFRGGSAMLMACALRNLGVSDRTIWLYDTFEGMSEPTDHDVTIEGFAARDRWRRLQCDDHNEWVYAPLDEVRHNLARTGYPSERLRFVQGKVEDTVPAETPTGVALLRLDTDWYESTYHELVHLYPRLTPGGVLILDDYGHWQGARDATDQYFAEAGTRPLLTRVDYSGRMAVKPA